MNREDFDFIASHYRWLETIAFGRTLQKARSYWIDQIPRPSRTLTVGEGDARFLCELLQVHPQIDVDCVDASERMLDLARKRVRRVCPKSSSTVRFHQENLLNWSPTRQYDLIVTHFFLDCFGREELELVIGKLAKAACEDAVWLTADFAIPGEFFPRLHATLWLRTMYWFFGVVSGLKAKRLFDPKPFLETAGFAKVSSQHFRWRMLQSDIYIRSSKMTSQTIAKVSARPHPLLN